MITWFSTPQPAPSACGSTRVAAVAPGGSSRRSARLRAGSGLVLGCGLRILTVMGWVDPFPVATRLVLI